MSKFIIVSGSYDPYPKANAVCAMAIEEELKKRGHEVTYIVTRHNINQKRTELINGNRVYFIPKVINDVHATFKELEDNFYTSSLEKLSFHFVKNLVKFLFKLLAFVQRSTTRDRAIEIYKANFEHVMVDLLETIRPDAVLTFSVPFSSHLYTYDSIKKSHFKPLWNSFLLDPYSKLSSLKVNQKRIFKDRERLIFQNSDKCFLLNTLESDYSIQEYSDFSSKIAFFKLPFLRIPLKIQKSQNDGIISKENNIEITFAGTLYDELRQITFLLDFIKKSTTTNIRFHFIGKFYLKNLRKLEELAQSFPTQIFIYGFKSRDFVLASLKKSDILINIGNNNANQIPSKILEYIGLEKPILSFIRDKNDAALEYLNKYPYSYIIDENDETSLDNIVQKIKNFHHHCISEKVPTSALRNAFKGYLQEDITTTIVNDIERQIDESA